MIIGLTIVVLIISTIFGYMTLSYHESVHVQANKYFGVDSHVEYGLFKAKTVYDSNFGTKEDRDNAYLIHGINEAVAYNLQPMMFVMWATMIAGFLYVGDKVKGVEQK